MKRQSSPRLVVLDDPRSFSAEAYRVLQTTLHYATPGTTPRTVLVTSAEAGEGKSTTTANLGISLAQTDRSVLLVDADLRRPILHTLLRVPSSPGLSSYLSGTAMPEAVVTQTSIPNLSLIACGPIPPNPAELLSSRRMRDLLQTMGGQYDMVLLDSPPVLAASDATTLAPIVDGVLLVVGSGGAPEASLRRAKDQLEAVHARILGAVVNRFDPSGHGYSKRYYHSYERYHTKQSAGTPRWRGVRTAVEGGSGPSFQNGHGRLLVMCAHVAETIQHGLRRARHRARGVLPRVPQAWERESRLGRAGRRVAAQCAGAAETIQRQLRRARHRARGVLPRVPQAWERESPLGRAGRRVAAQCAGVAETIQRRLGRARHRALRNTMAAALTALATGTALVLIATGFLGRTAAPPDRVLPIAGRGPADQGPRAAPAPQASAPSHDEPRDSPRVETATPVTAALPAEAKPRTTPATPHSRMASGPAAPVQRPAVAPPARATSPVQVVAIRFGVIDRTQPEWTWSWRITIHKPSDTARVNARIEFIEFQGSTRRLVGYEEFCGLRLAGDRLAFVEGSRTLSAADSRRISTVTARVSAATDAAEPTTCRRGSASEPRVLG